MHRLEHKGLDLQPAQKNMYLFRQLHPEVAMHHYTIAIGLKGELKIEIIRNALLMLTKRHEALHSQFLSKMNEVQQVPNEAILPPSLEIIDAKEIKPTPPLDDLPQVLHSLKQHKVLDTPFDLATGPLWRTSLIQFDNNEHQLLFVFDHLILDKTSQDILLNEFSTIYNSLLEEKEVTLADKPHLFMARPIDKKALIKKQYWEKKLSNYTPFELYPELTDSKTSGFNSDRIPFNLNAIEVKKITRFIERHNTNLNIEESKLTLNMFFLVSLYILLYRYTGSTDLCIGTSINRQGLALPEKDLKKIISNFDNDLPLRADLSGNPSISEIFDRVKIMINLATQNLHSLEPVFNTSKEMIKPFDILFVLNEVKSELKLTNIESSKPVKLDLKKTILQYFELNLDKQSDGSIQGFVEFNKELFSFNYFERFIGHWRTVLNHILENPKIFLSDCSILTEPEKLQLTLFNTTEKEFKNKKYLHELFSERAKETPKATSIVYHGKTNKQNITWEKIEKDSNNLAALLQHKGIRRGKKVGISIDRSAEMIIAMLAIHKTGATIVPLDNTPGLPLDYKVTKTNLNAILVDDSTQLLFKKYKKIPPLINVKNQTEINARIKRLHLLYKKPKFIFGEDAASIYYTSGTTGNPKGVVVPFKGQLNLLNTHAARNPLPGSKFLCVADIKFDAMYVDLTHWVITQGGQLHIINNADRFSPEALTRIIKQEKINTIVLLPHIMEKLNPQELAPFVKVAITMGAAPDGKMIAGWLKYGIEIRNEYGPTENTVCSTDHPCKPSESPLSVGKPLANEQIYILDNDNMECPIDRPGRLVLGGAGLATGYYNNPTLTNEKFLNVMIDKDHHFKLVKRKLPSIIQKSAATIHSTSTKVSKTTQFTKQSHNAFSLFKRETSKHTLRKPFTTAPKSFPLKKIYETGDLGVRVSDGSIIFLGRIDDQVKIKGRRIELKPIKEIICTHAAVSEALVIKHPHKEEIIAYIVRKPIESKEEKSSSDETLFKELNHLLRKARVPDITILASIDFIDALPLGPTGKINIKALPLPTNRMRDITIPTTYFQHFLVESCASILTTEKEKITKGTISTSDSLEEIGIDSYDIYKLLSKISTLLTIEITYKDLLDPLNPETKGIDHTIQEIEKIILTHLLIKEAGINVQEISKKHIEREINSEIFISEDGRINGFSAEAPSGSLLSLSNPTGFFSLSSSSTLNRELSDTLNYGFKSD